MKDVDYVSQSNFFLQIIKVLKKRSVKWTDIVIES